MKPLITLLLFAAGITLSLSFTPAVAPTWTQQELDAANTAKNVSYMDSTEQQIVMYCNLARLYPKRFAAIEVQDQYGGSEAESLLKDLKTIEPRTALLPDSGLTESATCFQLEQSKNGDTGHDRKKCSEGDYLGENCSYGMGTPRSVVMQLMIDEGIPSHGHRWNILDPRFSSIGVAFGNHKKYNKSAVIDFR